MSKFKPPPKKLAEGAEEKSDVTENRHRRMRQRVLPINVKYMEGHLVCNDQESAEYICGECIAQSMIESRFFGVRDVCGLPDLLEGITWLNKKKKLQGVNPDCWMLEIAEQMLASNMIIRGRTTKMMGDAIEKVEEALIQNVEEGGILNIINCIILSEIKDEVDLETPVTPLGAQNDYNDDDDEDSGILDDAQWLG